MPRSQREWALRKLKMALGCIDKAGEHLEAIRITYKNIAPQVTIDMQKLQEPVLMLSNMVEAYHKKF